MIEALDIEQLTVTQLVHLLYASKEEHVREQIIQRMTSVMSDENAQLNPREAPELLAFLTKERLGKGELFR